MLQFEQMKRSPLAFLAAGLLALAALVSPASALVDLQTLEQGCLWGVFGSSFTSATSKTVDVMGYGNIGYSSVTANAFLFDYSLFGTSSMTYVVVQTTKTPNASAASFANNNPSPWDLPASVASLSTAAAVGIPANLLWPVHVSAYVKNPVFYLSSLSSAATYFFQATFCAQQKP